MKRKTIPLALGILVLALCAACSRSGRTLRVGVYSGSYWGTSSNDCYQVLDDAISRFEEEHPGVQVEYSSGIGPEAYSEWLAEKILLGKEPDVYFVLPEDFSLLVECGALENLEGLMEQDPEFEASAYYDSCLRAGVLDGQTYALPYESVPPMMFVNRTLLEEHGLEVPGNDWTWDDFYRICRQVTDGEHQCFGVYDYDWVHALYSNGASLFTILGGRKHPGSAWGMNACRKNVDLFEKVLALRLRKCYNENS